MNTKKKRVAPKKRLIKHFLALTLAGSLLLPGLVLIQSQRVEANIIADMAGGVVGKLRYNATIAEVIISLLAGSGAAVTNTDYLNKLNAAYGVESSIGTITGTDGTLGAMYEAGLFTVDSSGAFIDNGLVSAIESVPEYTTLGISDYMATWAVEEGVETVATSAAENIGSSIGAATVAGTLCQVAGAFMFGYNLGNLAVNFVNWAGDKMACNAAINYAGNLENMSFRSGYNNQWVTYVASGNNYAYSSACENGLEPVLFTYPYNNTDDIMFIGYIRPDNNLYYYYKENTTAIDDPFSGTRYVANKTISTRGGKKGHNIYYGGMGHMHFNSASEYTSYINGVNDGTIVSPAGSYPAKNYSPDVIGPQGNQRPINYNDPKNITSWPNIGQQTPEGKGITAIPWNDYQDFVDQANQNTTNNITNIEQGDTYNNFITNYYVTPDTTNTPENNPTVETPDYKPIVPEQPTPNTKPTNTPETNQSNTDYMTTPGLKDVFPFCIPWDIAALFGSFGTIEREAPVVTFPIVSNLFGIDEEVTLDLSPYDGIAALLRTLELIGFGIGLAFVTRYLIGAGS